MNFYNDILNSKSEKKKLLAILLDPDKIDFSTIEVLVSKINESPATHVFVGGSLVETNRIEELILKIKSHCSLPVLLFPGNPSQISDKADGILFLSLLSGRNPDYLIEHQVNAVSILEKTKLEIIPTAYLLIESGKETAVERVSQTKPLDRSNIEHAYQTAKAGEFLGSKLVYLEAGSGAQKAVPLEMIQRIATNVAIPLIVGGGIRSKKAIDAAYNAGADMVVIGTAFENDNTFFES